MFHGCVCVFRAVELTFFFSGEGEGVCACGVLGGEMRCVLETYVSEVDVVLL